MVVVTTLSVTFTSWSEFSDTARKLERYTRAHVGLRKLLTWWESLGEVEKASKENITSLVQRVDQVISDEHLAWISTSGSGYPTAELPVERRGAEAEHQILTMAGSSLSSSKSAAQDPTYIKRLAEIAVH